MIGERVGASDATNFSYLQRVEAAIAEHGLNGRVQWTGHQLDEEVAADFNAIDVLVMPYEDGMSMRRSTLTAALANGCAIVTTHPQAPTPELVAGLRPAACSAQGSGGDRGGGAANCCGPAPGGEAACQRP